MRCNPSDINRVLEICMDDAVLKTSTDDAAISKSVLTKKFSLMLNNVSVYVLAPVEGMIMFFIPWNLILYEIHTSAIRGARTFMGAKLAVEWMINNTSAQKFITQVPKFNRAASILVRRSGMCKEGHLKNAFLKDGKLYDIEIFSISKGDVCQQQ